MNESRIIVRIQEFSFWQAALNTVMAGPRAGHLSQHKPAVKGPDSKAFAAIGGRP
jgi:hypothetical protein